MDQTETRSAEDKLNEALVKVSEMAEKLSESATRLNDSANKLCESATHINQSAARIERANISKGSSLGMLFWLLVLAIVIVAALYFSPHSAVKPYVDRAGAKLEQIGSRVATKMSSTGVQAQNSDKGSTAPLSANAATPTYPAYPAYPAYPPYSGFMDFGSQSAQNGTPDQAAAKPAEAEKAAPAQVKEPVAEAGAKTAVAKTAPVKVEAAKPEPAKPVAAPLMMPTPPTPPAPSAAAGGPAFPAYPAYPPYPTSVSSKSVPIETEAAKPAEDPNSPVMVARKAARERHYGAAIHIYDTYLDAHPNDADAWGEVGNVRLTAGRPREAAQNFYEAATRLIDQGRMGAVYPLLPIITQYQPQLAAILRQKMAKVGY
ncbi:MAG: hypothetical protein P4L70_12310 [Parasulfuritortus sp.]|jgi:hypothetical protein|nr:hypothetical protein [Parasulfuritortus sp.]